MGSHRPPAATVGPHWPAAREARGRPAEVHGGLLLLQLDAVLPLEPLVQGESLGGVGVAQGAQLRGGPELPVGGPGVRHWTGPRMVKRSIEGPWQCHCSASSHLLSARQACKWSYSSPGCNVASQQPWL